MTERRPAEVFPPADFLRDEMAERQWDAEELAARMGADPGRTRELVEGHRPMTTRDALALSRAMGTGPEVWVNLQAAYDSWAKFKGA